MNSCVVREWKLIFFRKIFDEIFVWDDFWNICLRYLMFWMVCLFCFEGWVFKAHRTSFEKMSWFEYWKHAFLKVIRMSSKVLYQHCMLLRYVGIVFWMQKIQRNSSNGQFHCFHHYARNTDISPVLISARNLTSRLTCSHQCFQPDNLQVHISARNPDMASHMFSSVQCPEH